MTASNTLAEFVDRADQLWQQRTAINADFRVLHDDVKDAGLDIDTFRQIVREHRMDQDALQSRLALLDQYRRTLGMDFASTPLGEATVEREAAAATKDDDGTPPSEPWDDQGPQRRRSRPRKPFAEQPMHRERPSIDDAFDRARTHLGEPGTA
jgi:uncharacterized protein (UPF0335 family)